MVGRNYDEFVKDVYIQAGLEEDTLLFIMLNGQELTSEKFSDAAENSQEVFTYLAVPSNGLFSFPSLPMLPPLMDRNVTLPSIGLITASMDSQTVNLEDRLQAVVGHLMRILQLATELGESTKALADLKSILTDSATAARMNLDIHTKVLNEEFQMTFANSQKILDSINALLYRCPMDFALMKRIPVNAGVIKISDDLYKTLIDLKGHEWQQTYLECSARKDKISDLKESLNSLYQRLYLQGEENSLDENIRQKLDFEYLIAQIRRFQDETKAKVAQIKEALIEENIKEFSENLILVQKSGRLLNLAELSSKFTEAYLRDTVEQLNLLINLTDAGKSAITTLYELTKKQIDRVVECQEVLAQLLNGKDELNILLESLQSYIRIFEEVHAFPVAYVAVLCEQLRRVNFEDHVKKSFKSVEDNLVKLLSNEQVRRKGFINEIAKILDVRILGDHIHDSEVDGNAILFIKESMPKIFIDDIEQLEGIFREDIRSLDSNDPIRLQLERFLETMAQMKKRTLIDFDPFRLGTLNDADMRIDRRPGLLINETGKHQDDLLKSYESRIRSLERLLQESYAAAKKASATLKNDYDLNEDIMKLSESLMNFQGERNEWKEVTMEILKHLGFELKETISIEKAKTIIKEKLENMLSDSREKVSIRGFAVSDIVLFLPTVRSGVWSLFNMAQPNYYLNPNSLDKLKSSAEQIDWLVGRITKIERVKSEGKTSNPYRLPDGFIYHEVQAEPVEEIVKKQNTKADC